VVVVEIIRMVDHLEIEGVGEVLARFGLSEDEVYNGLFMLSDLDFRSGKT